MVLVGDSTDYNEKYTDWIEDLNEEDNTRLKIIKDELLKMEKNGSACFKILMQFLVERKSMDDIARAMKLKDADSAKSQKWKCQKHLKEQVCKRLPKC